ncbi:hypothetical protein PM082_009588 [Marasmius tenuissimus]|nr:hypothetical protein PM082_009588 [Marasmius tenuissimus]
MGDTVIPLDFLCSPIPPDDEEEDDHKLGELLTIIASQPYNATWGFQPYMGNVTLYDTQESPVQTLVLPYKRDQIGNTFTLKVTATGMFQWGPPGPDGPIIDDRRIPLVVLPAPTSIVIPATTTVTPTRDGPLTWIATDTIVMTTVASQTQPVTASAIHNDHKGEIVGGVLGGVVALLLLLLVLLFLRRRRAQEPAQSPMVATQPETNRKSEDNKAFGYGWNEKSVGAEEKSGL